MPPMGILMTNQWFPRFKPYPDRGNASPWRFLGCTFPTYLIFTVKTHNLLVAWKTAKKYLLSENRGQQPFLGKKRKITIHTIVYPIFRQQQSIGDHHPNSSDDKTQWFIMNSSKFPWSSHVVLVLPGFSSFCPWNLWYFGVYQMLGPYYMELHNRYVAAGPV